MSKNNVSIAEKNIDGIDWLLMFQPEDLIITADNYNEPIHVVPYVKVDNPEKGIFEFGDKEMDEIIANFEEQANDIPFDYNHATAYSFNAPASGWIKKLIKQKLGIFAVVEWTKDAITSFKNKEYKYVSPGIKKNAKHRLTGESIGTVLHHAALTNVPYLDGMKPIVNNDVINNNNNHKELDMALLKTLNDKLNLPAETTEELLLEHITKLSESPAEVTTLTDTVTAKDAEIVALNDKVKKYEKEGISKDESFKALSDEVKEMKKENAERDAILAFDNACKTGKIFPAKQKECKELALTNLAMFNSLYGKDAPAVVSLDSTTDLNALDKTDGDKEEKILKLTDEKMKADSTLNHLEALSLVLSENPELNKVE